MKKHGKQGKGAKTSKVVSGRVPIPRWERVLELFKDEKAPGQAFIDFAVEKALEELEDSELEFSEVDHDASG